VASPTLFRSVVVICCVTPKTRTHPPSPQERSRAQHGRWGERACARPGRRSVVAAQPKAASPAPPLSLGPLVTALARPRSRRRAPGRAPFLPREALANAGRHRNATAPRRALPFERRAGGFGGRVLARRWLGRREFAPPRVRSPRPRFRRRAVRANRDACL
jgi:hypothetical protein